MTDLTAIIQEKNAADTQWREERQTQRDNVTAAQDQGLARITTDPEAYARYLTMQGDNLSYSPGNIALVMEGMPGATVFGTLDRWRNLGRIVEDTERANGVKIFARSPNGKGYAITDVYDVSQTVGRELKVPQIRDDSPEMATAMRTLFNYSAVPVVVDMEIGAPAFYDEHHMELAIRPGCPDHEAFAAIASEVAHARFHNKGYNGDYRRAESDLDAQSVSYILCRRLGIRRDMPDLSRLPELYQGWDLDTRRRILTGIQDISKQIGRSIEKGIAPPQRTIPVPKRAAR